MTNADKLKIGLDFHGVITDNPEYFKVFANEALRRGYEFMYQRRSEGYD